MKTILTPVFLFMLFPVLCRATTWDEPWMDTVIKNADVFVKADITEKTPDGIKARLLKHLAGEKIPEKFDITGFSLLNFGSYSVEDDFFQLEPDMDYYLFIKRGKRKGQYLIATPTTGWAIIRPEGVAATYRHSYHQALVPEMIYEKSMSAIFNKLHGKKVKSDFIHAYMKKHLSREPALISKAGKNEEITREFFLQHVALELFRYFGAADDVRLIDPFLSADDYHVQISAVRAIDQINSNEAKKRLIKFIEEDRTGFAKVMAVWGLEHLGAVEYKRRLEAFMKNGKDEKTGFSGNIMDPRVGTQFPTSVKASISAILNNWKDELHNRPDTTGGK